MPGLSQSVMVDTSQQIITFVNSSYTVSDATQLLMMLVETKLVPAVMLESLSTIDLARYSITVGTKPLPINYMTWCLYHDS